MGRYASGKPGLGPRPVQTPPDAKLFRPAGEKMFISVKMLPKHVIIIYALGSVLKKFGV